MNRQILFQWAFYRILGLKDIGKFIKVLQYKYYKFRRRKYLRSINVSVRNDNQVDSGVEPMDAGKQTCPTWFSTRIFYGTEEYPTTKYNYEYWYGCRETFLMPIIPIPICSEEIVMKLGPTLDTYNECYNKYGRMHSLLDHKEDYSHVIWEECTIYFRNNDITYKNDPLLSTYYDKIK